LKAAGASSAGAVLLLAGCTPSATPAAPATSAPAPTTAPAVSAPTEVPAAPTSAPAPTAAPTAAPTVAAQASTNTGKVLRIRLYSDIQNVDPSFLVSENDTDVAQTVMSGLVTYAPNSYNIQNDLAESISTSSDGLTVTFKLREGVKWQQGYGEVTTDDVKFSYERIADPAQKSAYHDDWGSLDHVEIVDKYNGKIIMKKPFAPLWHSTLPVTSGLIVCKKYVQQVGNDKFATNPIGCGPYIFTSWQPKQKIVLTRNPDYFGTPPAYDEIDFTPMDDDKACEVALDSGEIDFGRISAASIPRYQNNTDVKLWRKPSLRYRWIGMDVQNPKLQDINVRQAIRYAIDVDAIVKATYQGQWQPEYALIPPGLVGYWADAPKYTRDVAKAKSYMQQAGISSLDLRFDIENTSEYQSWAAIAQQNLKDIGINLTINPMDSSSFWNIGTGDAGKNVELFEGNYSMEPDPMWAAEWFTCNQIGVWNWQRWCDNDFDSLYQQGLSTMDDTARAAIYIKMQQIWDQACHSIWISYGEQDFGYSPQVQPATSPHGIMQPAFFQPA
jgi:peptide/nickel transport system substrate-binding protein